MKQNYSLFYSYQTLGDVLIVIFDNEHKPTSHIRKKNVEVIYYQDEVIGYNIFDIQNIIKIRNNGLIYLPSPAFIEVINTILKNAGVELLAFKEESGYVIARVKEVNKLDDNKLLVTLDIGDSEVHTIIKNKQLDINQLVVVAKVDTRLNDGSAVKSGNIDGILLNGHICSEKELSVSEEDKILVLDEDEEVGKDFFMMEEKR